MTKEQYRRANRAVFPAIVAIMGYMVFILVVAGMATGFFFHVCYANPTGQCCLPE